MTQYLLDQGYWSYIASDLATNVSNITNPNYPTRRELRKCTIWQCVYMTRHTPNLFKMQGILENLEKFFIIIMTTQKLQV